jgi:RNA-directed DNA polymerase
MRIARDLLTVDDFVPALEDEAAATRSLMPEDLGLASLFSHDGAADWAYRRTAGEFTPIPEQLVSVRKAGHGVRPVAELSVRDRVLYRVLTRRWLDRLEVPDRSSAAYEAFRRAPINSGTHGNYVVSSDITACYAYIDHGLLGREILARTGDSDGVDALTSLLAGITGRSYGIPQQSGPSDLLAEAYLSVVERRLLRHGLRLWRYNDDFRVSVDTWSDALNAVDTLERECRAVGLVLNESKTFISKRATYEVNLDRRSDVLQEISDEVELDLTQVSISRYDVELIEPEADDVTVGAATKAIVEWSSLIDKGDDLTPEEREKQAILSDLVRWALPVLSSQSADDSVLEACGKILRFEQTLTPYVARYLGAGKAEPKPTVAWFEGYLGGNPYLTPWQAWWIAPALRAHGGSFAADSVQRAWLHTVWNDPASPEPVRAGLALTMSQRKLIDADGLVKQFDAMTETGRPYIARALGGIAPTRHTGALTLRLEDDWIKWAFDYGAA